MVDEHIHDEGEFSPAKAFLAPFLRVAREELRRYLGRGVGDIHVILSDRAAHARRFPSEADETLDLSGADYGDEETGDSGGRVAGQFRREAYAHAIATRITREHRAPDDAPVGEPAIFLDVATVLTLAAEIKVSDDAMLAKVAAHELSHVFRGHINLSRDGAVTHGWFAEGDAQRDAWQILTALLADPNWANVSMEARAAQVRLCADQPLAYRQFAMHAERQALAERKTLPQPQRWWSRPPRRVWELTADPVVEVPILATCKTSVGDLVLLSDLRDCSGPWVVVEVADDPRTPHPKNEAAVEEARRTSVTASDPSFKWLQLRRRQDLTAGNAPSDLYTTKDLSLHLLRLPANFRLARSLTESPDMFVKRRRAEENAD